MLKHLLITLLVFSFMFKNQAQCLEGDLELFSQSDIDYFVDNYPGLVSSSSPIPCGLYYLNI